MWHRIRSILATLLVKTPVRIGLGLLAAYLLFSWFAFEPLVKWAAPKFVADKSRHQLTLATAKFDPLALSLDVQGLKLTEPDGKPLLAFDRLFVDFETASLFRWAYTFNEIRLVAPHANVTLLANGQLNWTALIEAFKSEEEDEPDKPLPRLMIAHFALEQGRVDVADKRVGFETGLNPIDFSLDDLSTLPDDKGAYSLAATTKLGARIRWKGELSLTPTVATGQLGIDQVQFSRIWPYFRNNLNMEAPEGEADLALNYRVAWVDKKLSVVVDGLTVHLNALAFRGKGIAEPAVRLDSLALTGGRFDLDSRTLEIGSIALQGGQVALARDRQGRLDIQDWFVASAPSEHEAVAEKPVETAPVSQTPAPQPWKVNLAGFSLDGVGVRMKDATFSQPLAVAVGNVKLGFHARAEAGAGAPQVIVEGLGLDIGDIRLTSGAAKSPFFSLAGIFLKEGALDLARQQASLAGLRLEGGTLSVVRNAAGQIDLLDAFRTHDAKPAAKPLAIARADGPKTPAASAWRYRVEEVGLDGFQIQVRDESVQPAGQLDLVSIKAAVKGVSEDLAQALPVQLSLNVKQGGAFQTQGKVVPAKAGVDLQLKLSNLSLKPAQPYVSQAANLTLASGAVSGSGRLKFDGGLRFDGGFQVADLLLNETEGGARFLAWKRLSSDSLRYRPEALDIDELKLDGLGAKLVIYQDKTVNLKKILKSSSPSPGGDTVEGETTPVVAAKPGSLTPSPSPEGSVKNTEQTSPPATRMTIDRIRVENGELDFADHSLSLPFGTRIHKFRGAFNGISTQPGSAAQLELDGQVDEYGLARAVGQLDLFDPTAFMDIKVVFQNVEMTSLTPYTATFVGRKIQSGKLSLDLEYKIKNRELLGENQIIMDKLTLGERVESPTAKDLPLDLAIAILQDSDGRIDLGLPVSGSLDDPQFSYGRIIWKAIGNILTKIVTAPFRALGALFGGGGEKLEKIAFEAGEAGLTPPEKEKLKQIAAILNKRPGLSLTVHPAWSVGQDRPVMKEARLRRAVAEKMGLKLRADEEPGPISTGNPKVQGALEALYAARLGETEWNTLQAKWRQANPEKQPQSGAGKLMSRLKGLLKKDEPLSEADRTALQGTDLHGLLYERLLAGETVTDADLQALARSRGEAVVAGLAAAGAPAERVQTGVPEAAAESGGEIPARMELAVAKR